MITTSYKKADNRDTLVDAPLTRYRLVHWMRDVIANFLSDPDNIRDERLAKLLPFVDNDSGEGQQSMVRIGLPFADGKFGGCTPLVVIVPQGVSYQNMTFNAVNGFNGPPLGGILNGDCTRMKTIDMAILVLTESLDGTLLFGDILEEFLVTHARQLKADGPLDTLIVSGQSEVSQLQAGKALNAKDVYQTALMVKAVGSVSWTEDTQGPLYLGTTTGAV